MKRPIISVDIDDVLADNAKGFVDFSNSHVYHYEHDVTALEVLLKLKNSFDLIVVTARRTQTKGDTLRWVKEKYPGIFEEDKIYFAGIWDNITAASRMKTKGDLLKDLGVKFHIDDQLKHCLGAHEQGIQSLLFGEYSWNKTSTDLPESIVRVKNWAKIQDYFDGRTN